MNKLSAQEFASLISDTQKLLGLYYHKDKWKSIYPTISHLSEQYDEFFQLNPNVMLAQLNFYLEKQGYTTNLVINQIILVLSICESLNINKASRQQYIAICLSQYICIQKENNAIAANNKLSAQGLKLYKMRYALALKLISYGQVPDGLIQQTFKALTHYKQVLLGKKQAGLNNINILIISIASLLAKKITLANNQKAISLNSAITNLYQNNEQLNVLLILKKLIAFLPDLLPGTLINKTDNTYYIGQYLKNDKQIDLTFAIADNQNANKGKFSFSKDLIANTQLQHKCADQGIIIKVWFDPLSKIIQKNELKAIINKQTEDITLDTQGLVSSLNAKNHHTIEELCELLNSYPVITKAICRLASKANRTEQNIDSIRHAIMMLGASRTPLLIQKTILELQLKQLGIPHWYQLKSKINALVIAAQIAADEIYDFLPEEAGICILSYCFTLLSQMHHHSDISKQSPYNAFNLANLLEINSQENQLNDTPMNLSAHWIKAIQHIEKLPESTNEKHSNHVYCIGLAMLAINKLYHPKFQCDAYANAFIVKAVKHLNLKNLDNYINKLLEQNLTNQVVFS